MQRYVGVLVIAAIAGLIGLGFLAGSAATRVQTTTFSIPSGGAYCTYRSFAVLAGGSVTITYSVSSGMVYQYVMTDAQHTAWQTSGLISYIGADQGSANTFTTTLPSGGTYYVLSCHGTGFESTVQSGQHTLTITGVEPGSFYAGIGGLLVTLLLVLVALRVRSRDAKRVPFSSTPPPYTPAWGGAPGAPPWFGPGATPSAAAGYGTLLVNLENRSTAEETVQLLLNGSPALTVIVPAGGKSQATLHPPLAFAAGTAVRIEAATPDGRRGGQDVLVRSDQAATVTLQIG